MTEQQLADAYRLYELGLSLRKVAAQILPDTGYASAASCARGLEKGWKRRGWELRDRAEATRAAHVTHGLGNGAAAKRWRRRQRGLRPVCKGIKTQYPNKGRPCEALAMAGSEYCVAHNPDLQADRDAHLAAMRGKLPARGRVHDRQEAS